jgi:hypothetical protein
MRLIVRLGAPVGLALFGVAAVGSLAMAQSGIAFLDSDPIALEVNGEPAQATVWIVNNAGAKRDITLSLVLQESGAPSSAVTIQSGGTVTVEPGQVASATLVFARATASSSLTGHLVATTPEGDLATRPLNVARSLPTVVAQFVPAAVPGVLAAALVAGVLTALLAVLLNGVRAFKSVGDDMGPVAFDAKESIGSVLTLGGAIVGAIAAAGILPEEPFALDKSELAGLTALFALVLLVAPLIYRVAGRLVPVGDAYQEWSYVGVFVIVVGLLAAATVGQIFAVGLLLADALLQDVSGMAATFVWVALAVAALVIVLYVARWASWTIKHRDDPPADQLTLFSGVPSRSPDVTRSDAQATTPAKRTWTMP